MIYGNIEINNEVWFIIIVYSKMLRDPNLGLGNTGTFKLNSDSPDIAGFVAIVEPET